MFSMNRGLEGAKDWFFDRARVVGKVEKGRYRAMYRGGALVRRIAKSSIRKARRKRISELTHNERIAYEIQKARLDETDGGKPVLPFKPSEPGEPPKSRYGQLKKFIFYFYDSSRDSVIIGPIKLQGGTTAPQDLEYGKAGLFARPYMVPALGKARSKYDQLFKNMF